MVLGTTAGTAAATRGAAALLDTVLFTVAQVRTTALDLRIPVVHVVQRDAIFFSDLDTAITSRNYGICWLKEFNCNSFNGLLPLWYLAQSSPRLAKE